MDKKILQISSVPIHLLDTNMEPVNGGSGCLISYDDCDYIFTVYHVVKDAINGLQCGLLIDYDPIKQKPRYALLGDKDSFALIKNNSNNTFVEFAYKKINQKLTYKYEIIDPKNISNILESHERIKYSFNQIKTPQKDVDYGFCGWTNPIKGSWYTLANNTIHDNYKYKETRDFLHIFEPPIQHPGHVFYQGISGAPIIDESQNVVSLLVGGDTSKNEVWGIDLATMLNYVKKEEGIVGI